LVGLFFILLILAAYSYLIYPGVLSILSRCFGRGWLKEGISPSVTLIISAYNEERVIEEKVRNALALDYPEDRLQVIVSSDGSTDRTDEIVRAFESEKVRLIRQEPRAGKTACLNRVVPEAGGEIVLFTDANSMFPSDVLKNFVRHFADDHIGLVTGWTKYRKPGGPEETTGLYSRFEKWCKVRESLLSSCVGADGAVFAIRKGFYRPLQDYDINDFVIPLDVIRQGKRVVLDPDVFCFEEPSEETASEYKRQVRITTRTLGAISRNLEFLNPLKHGLFSFLLFSHKVMRFLVPFFIAGVFVGNLFILDRGTFFLLSFAVQSVLLVWSLLSLVLRLEGKMSGILKFFLATFTAQTAGWVRTFMGAKDTTWKPER
jgi:cellulose synthase/poly-beta-1,6-N-acetylglucosamine synthase-like glycosyltransferase